MKIARNDRCPCGSGKKYKHCHGDMIDKPILDTNIPLESAVEERMNDARIKHCIHPHKEECSGKIIRAHSIQNNRILNNIGRNGEVYMVKHAPTYSRFKMKFKLIGRGIATTFTGFCGYHDNKLFEPIEDADYSGTIEQHFLFAYRAFSFEYHKKLEAQNAHKRVANVKPSILKSEEYLGSSFGYDLGIKDSLRHKSRFGEALLNKDYSIVETVPLVFNGSAGLAVCSGFYLEYNIGGKLLNDLSNFSDDMRILLINVFPQAGKTIVLFSWLREDGEFYEVFKKELLGLTSKQQLQMLNNLIPSYCENAVYNPDFIDGWDDSTKRAYLDVYYVALTSISEPSKRFLLRETKYNLFEHI